MTSSAVTAVRTFVAATLVHGLATLAGAQVSAPRLEIVRDSGAPTVISAADFAALPHMTVQAMDHGTAKSWSAVPLLTLLGRAGVPLDSVRGPLLAVVVVATAADGYRATFSLGELAADIGRTVVYVADTHDGAPLGAGEGPLRLVVPNDQRPARWVRQLVRITVRRVDP